MAGYEIVISGRDEIVGGEPLAGVTADKSGSARNENMPRKMQVIAS